MHRFDPFPAYLVALFTGGAGLAELTGAIQTGLGILSLIIGIIVGILTGLNQYEIRKARKRTPA